MVDSTEVPQDWTVIGRRSTDRGEVETVVESALTTAVTALVDEVRAVRVALNADRRIRRTLVAMAMLVLIGVVTVTVGFGMLGYRLQHLATENHSTLQRVIGATDSTAVATAKQSQTDAEDRIILCVENKAERMVSPLIPALAGCPELAPPPTP